MPSPREIAIDIRESCRSLKITPKRLFFEAGVSRSNYTNWRHLDVTPRPENLRKVYEALERREATARA